jgi:hypothetical protein
MHYTRIVARESRDLMEKRNNFLGGGGDQLRFGIKKMPSKIKIPTRFPVYRRYVISLIPDPHPLPNHLVRQLSIIFRAV